jgi:hypothetical protein
MSRHRTTRRTIRLYAIFASVTAALGIGVALGADPWPSRDRAAAPASAGYTDAQPIIRTGSS